VGVSLQGFVQDAQHQRSGLQNFAWNTRAGNNAAQEKKREGEMGKSSVEAQHL
jgi:hypothetical protein